VQRVGSRLLPSSLRGQLSLAIALVTAVALGVSFVALYRGTGARLRDQIDLDLKSQLAEFDQATRGRDLSNAAAVQRAGRDFIASQAYHAASRVLVIDPVAGSPVTNHSNILEEELSREGSADQQREEDELRHGLLSAPEGLATVSVDEAGAMRVLTHTLETGGRRVGTLRIADPLTSVEDAQESLLETFALVGAIALALAIAAGTGIATLIARPLRRMARVAAAVDAGDLSQRAGPAAGRGEVGVLGEAFDHMLARLERAFARQREFVSDASHELRTPLAVLRAQIELLDRATDERTRHEGTELVLRRLDEMDRLVADMLTLAGAEAGRLIVAQPIELDDFFEDLRRDLPLFGERDFHVAPVGGVLDADPDRLTQVLRNLVRNAVAHTHPGDRIDVTALARGDRLRLTIADTGPGIPPEQLERIFERFYRADESRARDSGGSGLGLAIARAVVEAHGGRIWAESRPGHGTSMHLELPGYRPPA
jgi:two-component system OmpR family sensor kinase